MQPFPRYFPANNSDASLVDATERDRKNKKAVGSSSDTCAYPLHGPPQDLAYCAGVVHANFQPHRYVRKYIDTTFLFTFRTGPSCRSRVFGGELTKRNKSQTVAVKCKRRRKQPRGPYKIHCRFAGTKKSLSPSKYLEVHVTLSSVGTLCSFERSILSATTSSFVPVILYSLFW